MTVAELIAELLTHEPTDEVFMANWQSVDFVGGPWHNASTIKGIVVLAHISSERGSQAFIENLQLPS